MTFCLSRAGIGVSTSFSACLPAALVAVGCTFSPTPHGGTATKVAHTDRLRVTLDTDLGEPASGEVRGLPEVVYNGRFSRIAVTVTDSDVGLPVGPMHIAAKVVATTWVSPSQSLRATAPQEGRHAGYIALPTRGPYRIDIEVEWPGGRSHVQFGFDY
jgi:hypothetical protein